MCIRDRAKNIYEDLDEKEKREFRCSWMVKKSFEFTREVRIIHKKHVNVSADEGEYMNKLQIARELGGVDQPEAMEQMEAYCNQCKAMGG
eukprot:4836682-Karenia_brevis.AAC.1